AVTEDALGPHDPALALDQVSADEQTQTEPVAAHLITLLDLEELLEDAVEVIRGDPSAGIPHGDAHAFAGDNPLHCDLPASRRELESVVDEIGEHFAKATLVAQHCWQVCCVRSNPDAALVGR